MKDLTFDESQRFVHIVTTAIGIAKKYGYSYIETPILEETALFKRSVGESSDIVGKEMYQFEDKGGNDVCMRPEGTAGVVRAFVSAKLENFPFDLSFPIVSFSVTTVQNGFTVSEKASGTRLSAAQKKIISSAKRIDCNISKV